MHRLLNHILSRILGLTYDCYSRARISAAGSFMRPLGIHVLKKLSLFRTFADEHSTCSLMACWRKESCTSLAHQVCKLLRTVGL